MHLAAVADIHRTQGFQRGEGLGGADTQAGAAQQPAEGQQVGGQRPSTRAGPGDGGGEHGGELAHRPRPWRNG